MKVSKSTPNYFVLICLWCLFMGNFSSIRFFFFGLIEVRRLIIDFIRSLARFISVVHTKPEQFKNAAIIDRFVVLFEEISASVITWFS